MNAIGIRLDNNYEIELYIEKDSYGLIGQGIVIGNNLEQTEALILLSHKGEIKEFPLFGIGIEDIINDNELSAWKKEITYMLSQDGIKVKKIELTNTNINLEANI